MAILKLQNLVFYPIIGVYDYEQNHNSKIEVSIVIEGNKIIPTNGTPIIDYAKLYEKVKSIVYQKKHKLIETLAWEILQEVKNFTTEKVTVEVCKYPDFLGNGKACIIVSSK